MKRMPWERLQIEVKVKELNEDECREILKNRTYRTLEDFKFYVASRCLHKFATLVKHIRLYSVSYGVSQEELLDDLYRICIAVNPLLTARPKRRNKVGAENYTEDEVVTQKFFGDISKEDILSLGDKVKEVVVGQDKAIEKVILAVQRASAGLRDTDQPIGSFLLTGPTGVGKTYLAKVLAEILIDDMEALIRIDCSEYQARHEYAKLIGAPHGYIGYEQGGILTNAIKKRPFAIVLFDEVEKAHDNIYNLLLQIMDEGVLTDNNGKAHSFKDAIILMTSNLGVKEAEKVVKTMGFGDVGVLDTDKRIKSMERALKKNFRPEFLNRLDEVSHFMPLEKDVCKHIVTLELDKLLKNLKDNKNITVSYSQDVIDLLHDKGFDAYFGARPLRRCIRKDFANTLAHSILMEDIKEGDTITAEVINEKINFK